MFSKDKTSPLFYPQGRKGSYTVPSEVTSIGYCAFEDCSNLTGVSIPEGVTSIGDGAFYNCTELSGALIIPQGVTSIGKGAFYNCTSLTSVTIPESVTSIGAYSLDSSSSGNIVTYYLAYGAFDNCSALTNLTIPAGLTGDFANKFSGYSNLALVLSGTGSIPDRAFSTVFRSSSGESFDCAGITSVIIGNGITGIGQYAFSSCKENISIIIGSGVTMIGQAAFSGCSGLVSVTIPSSVINIEQAAFSGCTRLPRVTIPSRVTSIGQYAFSDCTSLISVAIPENVTSIGKHAFSSCTSLTGINVASGNEGYRSINGVLVNKEGTILIQYPAGASTTYTIPSSIETIGAYAFEGCTSLTGVIIPNSINGEGLERLQRAIQSIPLIGGFSPDFVCIDGVSTIESYAFEGCTSLTRVTFLGPAIYDHRYYELEWVTDIIVQLYPMSTGDAVVDKFIDIIKSAYDPSTGDYNLGFYDNAFPQGSGSIFGSSGNALKDAYIGSDLKGTAGTYIRTAGGSYWSRQ